MSRVEIPEDMQGCTFDVVFCEGEVYGLYGDSDEAEAAARGYNNQGMVDAAIECGREPEDCTDEEMAEYAFMAGFEGGHAYADSVMIPCRADYSDDEEGEEAWEEELGDGYVSCNNDTYDWEDLCRQINTLICTMT